MADLESAKAVFLQQPNGEKLQLELKITQVVDDTNAIKSFQKGADISIASFDYATGIAVFLALCATALAYWFGVRSFKLTEMSFNLVSNDIKESAQTNLKTSELMMQNQIRVLEIQKRNEVNDEVRAKIAIYLSKFSSLRQKILMEYAFPNGGSIPLEKSSESGIDIIDKVSNHYLFKEMNNSYSDLISLTISISLIINPYEENSKCLLCKMDALNDGVLKILPEIFFKEKNIVEKQLSELQNIRLNVHKYSILVVGES